MLRCGREVPVALADYPVDSIDVMSNTKRNTAGLSATVASNISQMQSAGGFYPGEVWTSKSQSGNPYTNLIYMNGNILYPFFTLNTDMLFFFLTRDLTILSKENLKASKKSMRKNTSK